MASPRIPPAPPAPPRPNSVGNSNAPATSSAPSADDVIKQQEQTSANNNKLAIASAKAMDEQARNEFLKSMHEMQAKSIKSSGEALKGLA